jgi:hypothetical protein
MASAEEREIERERERERELNGIYLTSNTRLNYTVFVPLVVVVKPI